MQNNNLRRERLISLLWCLGIILFSNYIFLVHGREILALIWQEKSPDIFLQGGDPMLGTTFFAIWVICLAGYFPVAANMRAGSEKRQKKAFVFLHKYRLLLALTLPLCCIWFALAGNIYYLSDSVIRFRPSLSWKTESYTWSDVEHANIGCVYTQNRGHFSNKIFYDLLMKDGTRINLNLVGGNIDEFMLAYSHIHQLAVEYGVRETPVKIESGCVNYYQSRRPEYANSWQLLFHGS